VNGPARLQIGSVVVEAMDAARIRKHAGALVGRNRPGFPRFPVPGDDLHELFGAVVTQIVRQVFDPAEVLGFSVVERG